MILKLACEQCGAPISATNINIDKAIAKCTQCGCVFSFEKNLPSTEPANEWIEVEMPDGIDVLHLASELTLYIKWSSAFNKFLIMFAAIWNSVVLLFVLVAVLTGQWIVLLFISVHLAVAIGLTYYLIALRYNTTEISVTKLRIAIKHKPIWVPLYINREVGTFDVKQLFTTQYLAGKVNQQPQYAYEVKLLTKSDKTIRLVHSLKKSAQAKYIEQEIEKYLQIKNVHVEGEMG